MSSGSSLPPVEGGVKAVEKRRIEIRVTLSA
jgi:hypothetical protein